LIDCIFVFCPIFPWSILFKKKKKEEKRERETNESNLEAKKNQVVILRFSIHVQYRFNADLMRLFEDLEKKLA